MSSKINLQPCEYARKSSIFQDNQLIFLKCIKKEREDIIGVVPKKREILILPFLIPCLLTLLAGGVFFCEKPYFIRKIACFKSYNSLHKVKEKAVLTQN